MIGFEKRLHDSRQSYRISIRQQSNKKRRLQNRQKLLKTLARFEQNAFDSLKFSQIVGTCALATSEIPAKAQYQPQDCVLYYIQLRHLVLSPSQNQPALAYMDMLYGALNREDSVPQVDKYSFQQAVRLMARDLLGLVKKYAYNDLQSQSKKYLDRLIDILVVLIASSFITDQKLKLREAILDWATGSRALQLIAECVTEFLSPFAYKHTYSLINLCLVSKDESINQQALKALKNICQAADYDDINTLHEAFPQIFANLLFQSMREGLSVQKRVDYLGVIYYMMDTYANTIVDLLKMGVLELIFQILRSNSPAECEEALRTMAVLCCDTKVAQICVSVNVVLTQPFWPTVTAFLHSPNPNLKRQTLHLINQFCKCSEYDEIVAMLELVGPEFNILNVLADEFRSCEDPHTLFHCVQILHTFLYYSRKNMAETGNQHMVLVECERLGIVQRVHQLNYQTETEELKQALKQLIEQYLSNLQ